MLVILYAGMPSTGLVPGRSTEPDFGAFLVVDVLLSQETRDL